MTLPRYNGVTVQTTTNAPAPAATVTVNLHNTSVPADLFSDEAGSSPLANPLTSDAVTGLFTFCVANGLYDITVTGVALTPYTIPGVQLVYQGAPVGQLFVESTTLSHADLLALPSQLTNPTNGMVVSATPGANQWLVPLAATLVATIAVPYANLDANAVLSLHTADWDNDVFSYLTNGDATSGIPIGQTDVTTFLATAGTRLWEPPRFAAPKDPVDGATGPFFFNGYGVLGDPSLTSFADRLGQPLALSLNNQASGNLTNGDPANSLVVTVAYLLFGA